MDQSISQHVEGTSTSNPFLGMEKSIDLQQCQWSDRTYDAVTAALTAAIDAKDAYTYEHSLRLGDLALRMGMAMGLDEETTWNLGRAGLLHDIGKIGMPDCILHKKGSLTQQEYDIVKEHPLCGARILANIPGFDVPTQVALHHHEHFDGSGYPIGLRGHEIPLEARIVSVVDALDAMTSDRPYRDAMSRQVATEIIECHAGTQFDPDVVAVFLPLANNGFFDDILESEQATVPASFDAA